MRLRNTELYIYFFLTVEFLSFFIFTFSFLFSPQFPENSLLWWFFFSFFFWGGGVGFSSFWPGPSWLKIQWLMDRSRLWMSCASCDAQWAPKSISCYSVDLSGVYRSDSRGLSRSKRTPLLFLSVLRASISECLGPLSFSFSLSFSLSFIIILNFFLGRHVYTITVCDGSHSFYFILFPPNFSCLHLFIKIYQVKFLSGVISITPDIFSR